MSRHFSDKTFRFLRALGRNNSREWFAAHKADYETQLRQPVAAGFAGMAPMVDYLCAALDLEF